jgi:protein-tyrosine phosphatase
VREVSQFARAAARRILPSAWLGELRQYRAFEKIERPLYLKTRILSAMGLTRLKRLRPPGTARSFLFVCFGNIMRSPMCEAFMQNALDGMPGVAIKVTSAGLNAVPGKSAHPWALAAAREFGLSLENHRARMLTSQMIGQNDAILVMDYQNHVQVLSRWPEARSRVFMLSAYAGEDYRAVEISDPYYMEQEGTLRCYLILQTCVRNLVESCLISRGSAAASDSHSAATPHPHSQFNPNHRETPCK